MVPRREPAHRMQVTAWSTKPRIENPEARTQHAPLQLRVSRRCLGVLRCGPAQASVVPGVHGRQRQTEPRHARSGLPRHAFQLTWCRPGSGQGSGGNFGRRRLAPGPWLPGIHSVVASTRPRPATKGARSIAAAQATRLGGGGQKRTSSTTVCRLGSAPQRAQTWISFMIVNASSRKGAYPMATRRAWKPPRCARRRGARGW